MKGCWIKYDGMLCWRRWKRATDKREMRVGYIHEAELNTEYWFT